MQRKQIIILSFVTLFFAIFVLGILLFKDKQHYVKYYDLKRVRQLDDIILARPKRFGFLGEEYYELERTVSVKKIFYPEYTEEGFARYQALVGLQVITIQKQNNRYGQFRLKFTPYINQKHVGGLFVTCELLARTNENYALSFDEEHILANDNFVVRFYTQDGVRSRFPQSNWLVCVAMRNSEGVVIWRQLDSESASKTNCFRYFKFSGSVDSDGARVMRETYAK